MAFSEFYNEGEVDFTPSQTEVTVEDPNLAQADIGYVPIEGEYESPVSLPSLVSGLLALNRPDEAAPQVLLGASDRVAAETEARQAAIAEQELGQPASRSRLENDIEFLDRQIGNSGTTFQIETDQEGKTNRIQMQGSPNNAEFQGLGKYRTPEEFMQYNPEGFKAANPVLYQRMQAEAKARAEAPTLAAQQITRELDSKMTAILAEKDPLKQQAMIGELRTSAAISATEITKSMRVLAEDKAGIAKIQQQLLRQQQLDAMDPMLAQRGISSPITQRLTKDLIAAKQSVKDLTKQMIAENPTLAALDSKLKNFLSVHERNIARSLERDDKERDKLEAFAGIITPEAVKYLQYFFPDVVDAQSAAKKAQIMGKNATWRKEWDVILNPAFTDRDLLPMAAQGSKAAQIILTRQEMEKTGQSEAQVKAEAAKFMQIIGNDASAAAALKELPASFSRKNEWSKSLLMLSTQHDKESQGQKAMLRYNIATEYMKASRMTSAFKDVESWGGDLNIRSNPEAAAAIDRLKTTTGKTTVDIDSFIGEFVTRAPKEQQAERMDFVKKAAQSYAKRYEQATFGPVDLVTLNNRLQAKVALSSTIFGTINKITGELPYMIYDEIRGAR